jgi:hypothetical protein
MSAGALRRRVVVVWLLLAVLVVAVVVIESTGLVTPRAARESSEDPRMLLPVPVDQLAALEVADAGMRHRFERDAAGAWFYHGAHGAAEGAHLHASDPAAAERIERALAVFGRTRIERQLPRDREARAYGVMTPRIVILAYRRSDSQPLVQYAVGDVAPDGVSRYVDVVGGAGVVTIAGYQIDNLLALIEGVKSAAR